MVRLYNTYRQLTDSAAAYMRTYAEERNDLAMAGHLGGEGPTAAHQGPAIWAGQPEGPMGLHTHPAGDPRD